MLPHFIRHYRERFPGCRIIVYDNCSTDATARIARLWGCEVVRYNTNNQLDDLTYLEIKNHAWQCQEPGWVLVADCDELCDIDEASLLREEAAGASMIRFRGYNMVNMSDDLCVERITHGVADDMYSKSYLFDARRVRSINYEPGCHVCRPEGDAVYSDCAYPCYHYRYINLGMMTSRYQRNSIRMSAHNRRHGMGSQYHRKQQELASEFAAARAAAVKLREPMASPSMKVFVAGFSEQHRSSAPALGHLEFVNLSALQVGPLQDNRLSEHRIFVSDKFERAGADYVGLATWRWSVKCRHLIGLEEFTQLPLERDVVWAAWPDDNWYRQSCIDHRGIRPYLDEMLGLAAEQLGTKVSAEGRGLLANQFVCHASVYAGFQQFFRRIFGVMHARHGMSYDFWVSDKDRPRVPAVLYERIAAIYFSNRADLVVKQMPAK